MMTQESIQAAHRRACYGELVPPGLPVAWFGAGVFARRLAASLPPEMLAHVSVIFDDNASADTAPIAGIPVRAPDADRTPTAIVLATDTHAAALGERARSIWSGRCPVIDCFAPPLGSWIDPGDAPGGFVRTHPERWRESLGLAQLELERTVGAVSATLSAQKRWMLAHANIGAPDRRALFGADETERFRAEAPAMPIGGICIVSGDHSIRDDPFWGAVIADRHSAISPDGRSAAIIMARLDELPVCPVRTGGALWTPSEPTCIVRTLYAPGGAGAKRYTVRFDDGAELGITATRERTYTDLRGSSELFRYERVLPSLPDGARVLDCATGTGPGANYLASRGLRVTGVDVSADAIAFARRRHPGVRFVCASAADLPFPDDHFDAVVSIETIEHLPDPDAAMAEFARVCKPDGVLCLTTPDEGGCDSPYHEVVLSDADLRVSLDRAFGVGGWTGERLAGAGAWHAMTVRPMQRAQL